MMVIMTTTILETTVITIAQTNGYDPLTNNNTNDGDDEYYYDNGCVNDDDYKYSNTNIGNDDINGRHSDDGNDIDVIDTGTDTRSGVTVGLYIKLWRLDDTVRCGGQVVRSGVAAR